MIQARLLPALWPLWWRYAAWFLLSLVFIFGWERTAKYHAPRFIAEWFGPAFSFFGVPVLLVIGVAVLLGLVGKQAGIGRSILVLFTSVLMPFVAFLLFLTFACVATGGCV